MVGWLVVEVKEITVVKKWCEFLCFLLINLILCMFKVLFLHNFFFLVSMVIRVGFLKKVVLLILGV